MLAAERKTGELFLSSEGRSVSEREWGGKRTGTRTAGLHLCPGKTRYQGQLSTCTTSLHCCTSIASPKNESEAQLLLQYCGSAQDRPMV